jgi:competence protein ComEC
VKAKIAIPGEKFEIGDMKIEIFGPISENEIVNNNSVVVKITYNSVSFLFVGDAEKAEETDLINSGYDLNSTVLKVGHHGSKTSSTYKFLGKVSPKYAVISVGPDKSNLPKEKVLKRLEKFSDHIYRTDKNGTIIFLTDGKKIEVKTEK